MNSLILLILKIDRILQNTTRCRLVLADCILYCEFLHFFVVHKLERKVNRNMSWLYFQINLLLMLTLAEKVKRCVQFFVIFVVFRFQATLQAELEKETARFQKKFLQETVSETINFERNLSWNIMTSQCLYPNTVRSHCWWIFTAVPKRKKNEGHWDFYFCTRVQYMTWVTCSQSVSKWAISANSFIWKKFFLG